MTQSEVGCAPSAGAGEWQAPAPDAKWERNAPLGGNNQERGHPMSAEKTHNIQDVFLNYIRKNKTAVTIFLVNGVKLQGIITAFDSFCVLLRRDAQSQLVYKHAISTVMPTMPIQLFEPGKEGEEEEGEDIES
jgi:host factor-I protein